MWSIIIIVIIGMPLLIVSQIQSGGTEIGQLGLESLILLAAIGGAWNKVQKARVIDAQRRFWLKQK